MTTGNKFYTDTSTYTWFSALLYNRRLCCIMLSSVMRTSLRILIFQGSTRSQGPPMPARVGERIGLWAADALTKRGNNVVVCDPMETALPLLQKPHFAYARGKAPAELEDLAELIRESDAYVMITPEYNHAPSPALLNTLNHFGSSLFAFKPSAIISYSQGQWGGVRAAAGLRAPLSELGCLPVSAMIHIPRAHEAFDANGVATGEGAAERWARYGARTFSQLEWWAAAAASQRIIQDPFQESAAFLDEPAQRNAP